MDGGTADAAALGTTQEITREPVVLTIYDPDTTPPLMQRFRDLQSLWFIFLTYSQAHTRVTENQHTRCEGGALDHQAPLTRAERDVETLARLMLSAFLATYGSLLFYLKEAMVSRDGRKWLREQVEKRGILASFERLRNRETHHRSLSDLLGLRFTVDRISASPTSDDPDVSHVHFSSLHQGVGFEIEKLQDTKEFKNRPKFVKLLTDKSVLELAHDCVHDVSKVINEAAILGHLENQSRGFLCWLCRPVREQSAPTDDLKIR